jgi:hypothetical protein
MRRLWARPRETAHHAADSDVRSMGTKGDRLRTRRQLGAADGVRNFIPMWRPGRDSNP